MSGEEEKTLSLKDIRKALREDIQTELEKLQTELGKLKPKAKTHYVRSFEKYCPDCGDKNPKYTGKYKECTDCEEQNDTKNKYCVNCGGQEFEEREEEED